MSKEFELDAELAALEQRLGELSPKSSQLDRDALLYQSGWEAALASKLAKPPSASLSSRYLAISFATLSAILAFLLLRPDAIRPTAPSITKRDVSSESKQIAVAVPKLLKSVDRGSSSIANALPYSVRHAMLQGRRDPERWLRETDRMVAASSSLVEERPQTIQDLYREFGAVKMNEQTQSAGDQL